MQKIKQALRSLFSMKFAIAILAALLVFCIVSSFITQGETESFYTTNYSGSIGHLILFLGMDDAYHSVVFIVLAAFLCLNLLGCNILRFPSIVRRATKSFKADTMPGYAYEAEPVCTVSSPETLLHTSGFRNIESAETPGGTRVLYSVRNKIGIWGAWLTHLGLLIIILAFTLGQLFTIKYTVYGVAGQTLDVGDSGYSLHIDDFDIGLREDETVEQYTATLTMTKNATGESRSGQCSVNHPVSLFGMKLYQNSTGWAARVLVFKGDDLLQEQILCAGEYLVIEDLPDLVVFFRAFYPDYYLSPSGMPSTASSSLNNPGYFYSVFYQGTTIGMNVLVDGDYISIDDYTVAFVEPQNYTLIQIKHDPFTWLALIGGILICAAMFLAFYMQTEEVIALEAAPGVWSIFVRSRKSELLLAERLQSNAQKQKQ